MAHHSIRRVLLAGVGLAGGCFAAPAFAQEQAEDETGIGEIVVTARHRAESLQDVPLTVNAYSGEELAERGIDNFQELMDATPGVTIDSFPRSAPRPFFRGIGSGTQSAGGDPSSVAFLDGVYLGRGPMLAVDIFDMERVEVFKGPQGTLWGRNVVGGAVDFITARPVHDFEGRAAVSVGEFDQRNVNLVLNAPLSEQVAVRVALASAKNDGFRQTPDGGPLDDEDQISGRLHVLYDIDPQNSILFSVDHTENNEAMAARFNLNPTNQEDIDEPRVANPDRMGHLDRSTGGLRLQYSSSNLGWADFTTILGYRHLDFDSEEDFDGADFATNLLQGASGPRHTFMVEDGTAFTAEARLTSTGEGPFSWVAGAFYLSEDTHRERETETAVVDNSENRFVGDNQTTSYAAFGEVNYEIAPDLNVFAGLRATHEEKEYEITQFVGDPSAPTTAFTTVGNPGVYEDDVLTWRVGGDWRLNPNVFLFATVATGYKAGGFQEQPQEDFARIPTDPEQVTNFEAGFKTDWLDRTVRFNASVFQMDYRDLQTQQTVDDATQGPGGTRLVTDTADATIQGVETELLWSPNQSWEFGLTYAYLDATFDVFIETSEILGDGTVVFSDLAGNRLSRTPEHAVSGTAAYNTQHYDWGSLRFEASFNYESDVFDDNSNNLIEFRESRTLWDASVTFYATQALSLQLWGHNLTDEEIRVHQAETGGGHYVAYGAPRQVGLRAQYEF